MIMPKNSKWERNKNVSDVGCSWLFYNRAGRNLPRNNGLAVKTKEKVEEKVDQDEEQEGNHYSFSSVKDRLTEFSC